MVGKNFLNKIAEKVTMTLAGAVVVKLHRTYDKHQFTYRRENWNKVYGEALSFSLLQCLETYAFSYSVLVHF